MAEIVDSLNKEINDPIARIAVALGDDSEVNQSDACRLENANKAISVTISS